MSAIVPVSKADIMEKLPDISVKTVELVLHKMLKEDKITKIGTYRDARYMKKQTVYRSPKKRIFSTVPSASGNSSV